MKQPPPRKAARIYATNKTEQGGRVADAIDRESVNNGKGKPNAQKAISDRAAGRESR